MKRVRRRQLMFEFADRPKGSDKPKRLISEQKEWLLRISSIKETISLTARANDSDRLLEKVTSSSNLAEALLQVARKKGAAGVDGESVDEVVENARSILPKLQHELRKDTYRPGDIRRVWIPKPGGGQRGLGIPNVIDRWVQQAVLQMLQPYFEEGFHDSSHGFRPKRGAQNAIAEAKKYVEQGYKTVVDIDLSKFFDRVNHQRLLNRLAQRIKDGRILKLIHSMLKAKVVMPDGTKVSTNEGMPQGGPLSPLLSNVVLDELDKELERRGHRFVRYADDFIIYVRSIRAGVRVMNSIRQFIENRLRLKINETKSSVRQSNQVDFLGFRLIKCKDKVNIHLSKRSIKRINARIRELTPRSWGQSLKACIEKVNQYLKGWEAYFGICTKRGAHIFKRFDAHIRRRLRAIIIKQKRRARYLFRHLLSCGVPEKFAARCAYSRKGIWARSIFKGINMAYPNDWFAKHLVSLAGLWRRRGPKPGPGVQLLLPLK